MHSRIIILFFIGAFLDYPKQTEGQWCTQSVPVLKTRNVWRSGERIVTKQKWWGGVGTQVQPYSYLDEEHYWGSDIEDVCCYGYQKVWGECEPECDTCPKNSECTAPYTCTCSSGYTPNPVSRGDLQCKPACTKACPEHSSCSAPGKCSCDSGYQWQRNACKPNCSNPCPANAYCQQPNVCACNSGYESSIKNASAVTCVAVCANDCPLNSDCVAPDTCVCRTGYRQLKDEFCAPICEEACGEHSYCQAPNKCLCLGGYELDPLNDQCQPVCSSGCPAYSSCVEPDRCACDQGYVMNTNDTQCEAVCVQRCPSHSVCNRPNECLCDEGYQPTQLYGMSLYCEPICPQNCSMYGKCVAPDTCACLPGYDMQTARTDLPLCQPVCTQGCEHGFCFAPGVCVCNPGYLMGPNATCAPVCSLGCVNGDCVEPEICACSLGYRFVNNSVHACEPICTPDCEQADCVAPHICICWEHHEPDPASEMLHSCLPTCSFECLHGFCSAPNTCSCDAGYKPHSYLVNECVPSCKSCMLGYCVAPEVCQCWPGYEMVTEGDAGEESCVLLTTAPTSDNYISTVSIDDATSAAAPTTTATDTTASANEFNYDYYTKNNLVTSPDGVTTHEKLLQSNICLAHCKCWQEWDELGLLSTAKCARICVDDADAPCLDLSNCLCDYERLELVCNDTADSLEDVGVRYTCRARFSATTNQPFLHSGQRTEDQNFTLWILLVGCISGSLLIIFALYMAWQRYAHNNISSTADYVVDYHNGQ